jgi:hypothetical protein
VVSYRPEGDYQPPTGNMLSPGTLGIPEPVFAQVHSGDPARASAELGKALLDIRINAAIKQIRAAN